MEDVNEIEVEEEKQNFRCQIAKLLCILTMVISHDIASSNIKFTWFVLSNLY